MIPLCDVIPSRTRPVAILGIVTLTTLASCTFWLAASGYAEPSSRLGLAPAAWNWPGLAASLVVQPNSVVLIADLLAIWLFGATVEDRLGHLRFAALWAASGLAASLAHVAAAPDATALLLGGAGATAGVVTANLVLHPRGRILAATPVVIGLEFVDLPSWLYAGTWASVLLVATPSTRFETLAAAMGAGSACGCAAVLLLRRPERLRVEWWGA